MDYEKFEKECEKICEENERYLTLFKDDLISSGLKDATVKRHVRNARFFLDVFLLHEDTHHMQDGVIEMDMYFGEFFIRKCAWSTPATIKRTACSLKKFYRCMSDHGLISVKDYKMLCDDIHDLMPNWQDLCEQYNDPASPNPFFYFGGFR